MAEEAELVKEFEKQCKTLIVFDEFPDNTVATVATEELKWRNKLHRLEQERPEECKFLGLSTDMKVAYYAIPKKWVKIVPPRIRRPAASEPQPGEG